MYMLNEEHEEPRRAIRDFAEGELRTIAMEVHR